jgi:predicted nuclease of restriction endonuclease-like (RecB) superfamily
MAAKKKSVKSKKVSKSPSHVAGAGTTPVPKADPLPVGYSDLLAEIKSRIGQARTRAALAVNWELIELYWQIGQLIVERQEQQGWGKGVIDRLSTDIQSSFPEVRGFSPSNIWRMRSFYLAYCKGDAILAQAVRELETHGSGAVQSPVVQATGHAVGLTASERLARPVRDLTATKALNVLCEIPWGHNVVLLEKVKDPAQRLWYANQTVRHGWSRAVLVHQIELDLFHRQGKAQTNFDRTLPAPQSDLAREILKDPYTFDFLTLADDVRERELEQKLIEHIKQFLIELGTGFALVGSQYPLHVGGDDFSLDLLFYQLRLRCFVVIDLKVKEFRPEFAGKMSFYLSAIDEQLRHPTDQPSIGLILCKTRNRLVVEYTLRESGKPLGVATYQFLSEELKANLPTPAQLEAELNFKDVREPDDN